MQERRHFWVFFVFPKLIDWKPHSDPDWSSKWEKPPKIRFFDFWCFCLLGWFQIGAKRYSYHNLSKNGKKQVKLAIWGSNFSVRGWKWAKFSHFSTKIVDFRPKNSRAYFSNPKKIILEVLTKIWRHRFLSVTYHQVKILWRWFFR